MNVFTDGAVTTSSGRLFHELTTLTEKNFWRLFTPLSPSLFTPHVYQILKEAMYIIWCDVNRLGDSVVNRLGDTSAFVNTAGQLLLTGRGKTRMDGGGIVFEFHTAAL